MTIKEAETATVAEEIKEELTPSQDRRDALERAISESSEKEIKPVEAKEPLFEEEEKKPETPKLKAPVEFTPEEQADFEASTPKQQEAQLRLHASRQVWAKDLNKRHESIKHLEQIESDVGAYLKAMGDKNVDPRDALFKAIRLYKEANTDSDKFVAEFIKAKKLDGWTKAEATAAAEKIIDSSAIQTRIDALESKIREQDTQAATAQETQVKSQFLEHWQTFENTALDSGEKKFPDLANTETGVQLASKIGSLVGGQSELSKQWLANLRERLPSATMQTAFEEAYKWYGGKVSQSDTPKVLTKNNNLARTARLTASQPGRSALSSVTGGKTTYPTRREALRASLRQLNSE